ncbi:hypothetical protein [Kitasatospora sp. NPDC098663]|uniref:hypothetical protein n=1 Tax=Kitasatospora sp. NPDC098663 TaxID=3364096 RepID=UPI0037FB566A
MSPGTFAAAAGKARGTVNNYLATWDLLAEAGHVPSRDQLVPGVDVDLPTAATWKEFYRRAHPPARSVPTMVTPRTSPEVEAAVVRMFDAVDGFEERTPGPVAQALGQMADSLAEMREPDRTRAAYLRALDALAELLEALPNH